MLYRCLRVVNVIATLDIAQRTASSWRSDIARRPSMQQELWLRAKSQVLSSLKPVCAMRAAASTPVSARSSDLDAKSSVCTQVRSPSLPRAPHLKTRASSHTSALNNSHLYSHHRENAGKPDVNSDATSEGHRSLNNPVKTSRSHQELHKELLLAHKKGLVVGSKPELQQVLERRKREQTEREEGEQGRSPLEQVLLKRQQKHEEREKEEEEKTREEAHLLEFVRVRQNLRKIHSALYKASSS